MDILNEPYYKQGRVFYVLSQENYFTYYPECSINDLVDLADEWDEAVYICQQLRGFTSHDLVYVGGSDDD